MGLGIETRPGRLDFYQAFGEAQRGGYSAAPRFIRGATS